MIDIARGEAFGTVASRIFFIILHIRDPRVRPRSRYQLEDRGGVKLHTAEPIGRFSSSLCAFMCLACPLLSYLVPGAVTYQSVLSNGSPTKLLPTTRRKPLLVGGRCLCCPARSLVGKRYALATIQSIDIALI
jgi:hypothetical protein